jgi:hypothetical protein
MRVLPAMPAIVGIPACIAVFTVAAFLVGLISIRDVERLTDIVRRR